MRLSPLIIIERMRIFRAFEEFIVVGSRHMLTCVTGSMISEGRSDLCRKRSIFVYSFA